MKLLLSYVNSDQSLVGYDLETKEVFWEYKSLKLKSCGISYFANGLLVSSDNNVIHIGEKAITRLALNGPYDCLAHSIHPLSPRTFGVVDTGHSSLRIYDSKLKLLQVFNPLGSWSQIPPDAIHLNDFLPTPFGLYCSCFDYRPWRAAQKESSFRDWCSGGYGLILNVSGNQSGNGAGRIVMNGLNHPHSLTMHDSHIYCCSSATGHFHKLGFLADGTLREVARFSVTEKHFLRGAYWHEEDQGWILGGSNKRHGEKLTETSSLYTLKENGAEVTETDLEIKGEIYDILPWKENIMEQVISTLEQELSQKKAG